jgi:hypothetical protein
MCIVLVSIVMIDPYKGYGLHGGEMHTPKPKTGFRLGYLFNAVFRLRQIRIR